MLYEAVVDHIGKLQEKLERRHDFSAMDKWFRGQKWGVGSVTGVINWFPGSE